MKTTMPLCLFVATLLILTGCNTSADDTYLKAVTDRQINSDPSQSLELALQNPENLERLITEVAPLPAEIGTLTGLKTLHLGCSKWNDYPHPLKTLPPEIGRLSNLEKLRLYEVGELKTLPSEIGDLKNLKELYVKGVWYRGTDKDGVGVTPSYHYKRRGRPLFPLGLQELPKEIGKLKNLETLVLFNTEIQTLPDSIATLKKLKDFGCFHGDLRVIPPAIGECESLEFMRMPDNPRMGNLPPEIGNCLNLRYIWSNLNESRTAIPKEIGKLQNLEFLELGGSGLKIVPPELGNCSRLHSLNLGGGTYTELPPELGKLKRLGHLQLRASHIASIPPEWGNLHQLTFLGLERTHVTTLPTELGNLHNLRFLELRGSKVTAIPESFQALEKLEFIAADPPLADHIQKTLPHVHVRTDHPADPSYRIPLLLFRNAVERAVQAGRGRTTPNNKSFTLDWQNRGLTSVELLNPEQVTEIKFNGNQLTQIPAFIQKARKLKRLDLSGNPIPPETIADFLKKRPSLKIVLDTPAQLATASRDFSKACYENIQLSFADPLAIESIQLDYNEFREWPTFLDNLTNLETLDLDVNLIGEIPDSIGKLTQLRELSLGANVIRTLSPRIGALQQLEALDLSVNHLQTLPNELAALGKLKKLDLSGNEFETLPQVLFLMKNLETLDLRGNPISADEVTRLQKALPSVAIKI